MPDNVGQAIFTAAFRGAVRLLEGAFLPPRFLGEPTRRAPVGADPVIIIHGITDSGRGSEDFARSLRRDGFTVFTPTMPSSGMDGLEANAAYLRAYVAWVLRTTGARRVDLVTHSQGGLSALAYIRAGGGDCVDAVVAMSAPFHGVAGPWRPVLDAVRAIGLLRWMAPKGLMVLDQRSGSIAALMAGDETPGDVAYTSIFSKEADGIVFPASSPRLEGATNIVLDDATWGVSWWNRNHLWINHSSAAYDVVRGVLINSRRG